MHWRHCAHAQRQGPPSRSLSSSHRAESGTVALPGYLPRKGNHEPTGHDLDNLDHTTMIGRSVLTSIDKVTDNPHYSHMNTSVVSTLHIKVHPTTVDGSVWPQAPAPARARLKLRLSADVTVQPLDHTHDRHKVTCKVDRLTPDRLTPPDLQNVARYLPSKEAFFTFSVQVMLKFNS